MTNTFDLTRRSAIAVTLAGFASAASAQAPIFVSVSAACPPWIDVAAGDLADDLMRAIGRRAVVGREAPATIQLMLVEDPELDRIASADIEARRAAVRGQTEAFFWLGYGANEPRVIIVGTDPAGLRRGVYAFSRDVLKLDPTWRWTGLSSPSTPPEWERPLDRVAGSPRARLRGWFVNDEDLLTEWQAGLGRREIDYPYYGDVVSLDVLDRVVETAARLGMNMVSPASLINVLNPAEAALLDVVSRRGLKVTQHHVEPVGLSGFTWAGHWRERGLSPAFSFYSERERLIEMWRRTIAGWARHDTVWTLGLRGTGDRPLWLADPSIPRDDAVIGRLISEAIATQRSLVIESAGADQPEFATLLWAEGAQLLADGHLSIPDDVTIVFADNSPGLRFQDDYRLPREASRSYGIYYHHQLWSSGPHLVQATSPDVTRPLLVDALAGGADDYVLMNVSNVREFVVGLTLSADLVTSRGPIQDESLEGLCRRWFGPQFELQTADLYRDFFAAYAREPESGRMPFLDGLLRSMGQTLIARLNGSATGTDTLAAEPNDTRAWVQRALPDMVAVDASDPANRRLLQRQCEALASVQARSAALTREIGGPAGRLLHDNLLVQSAILIGLGRWVLALAEATDFGESKDIAGRRASISEAIGAVRSIEVAKAAGSDGEWRNWYRGDRKMNVPDLVARTEALTG